MLIILAVFGGLVGLAVTGAALYTVLVLRRGQSEIGEPGSGADGVDGLGSEGFNPLRWTVLDYGLLFVAAFAILFLLVDVLAVIRDSGLYPDYHVGYLLCGFVFMLLTFLFLYIRLASVLRAVRPPGGSAAEHYGQPDEAHRSE